MFTGDADERTLPPTERRRREAKQRGDVARSPEVTAAAMLVMASGTFWYLAPLWLKSLSDMMRSAVTTPSPDMITVDSIAEAGQAIAWRLVQLVGPIALVAFFGAFLSNFVQVGWNWTPSRLSPRPNWGFGNPLQRAVQAGWRLLQTAVLGLVCWRFWASHKAIIAGVGQGEILSLLVVPSRLLGELCFQLSLAMSVMAIGDYLVRFWRHEQSLKMTIEERRREMEEEMVDARLRKRPATPPKPISEIERI